MRQRVMIAMALSCEPRLIIADEPTTALDVTVQAQILELIRAIQEQTGAALLLITHDLGVVAEMVKDVVVMYAGRVVEHGSVDEVLLQPRHPYTEGLLASIPSRGKRGERLNVIRGSVPNPFNMPTGCNFSPRCPKRFEPCTTFDPRVDDPGGPPAACWLWKPIPVATEGDIPATVAPGTLPPATVRTPAPGAIDAPVTSACWLVGQRARQVLRGVGMTETAVSPAAPVVATPAAPVEPLIRVEHLVKYYPIYGGLFRKKIGDVKAVDDVSFDIMPREIFGWWASRGAASPPLVAPC